MVAEDHRVIADLERHYEDLDVGLADLSVVVAARRHGTRRVLTFDERHFRALRPLDDGHFTLLPTDEQPG
jgi:predicted nucleic acid-binding protein